jgi:hypothetical protein
MEDIKVLEIGNICPNCGSGEFKIISPDPRLRRPSDWRPNILGISDCRGCKKHFLVCLSSKYKLSILTLVKHLSINTIQGLLGVLFHHE